MTTTQIRNAKNYTQKETGTYGFGSNQKYATGTVNMIAIDNYGSVTVQDFNQIMAKAGVLDFVYGGSKRRTIFTDEYLTKLVNENLDLFPIQF